jgi:CDP-4-dehydro-6-deoxyglucose reductase, E1
MDKINLVKDTIDTNDINQLIDWLRTNPILTKNKLTIEFEENFSQYQNRKYSVFVNSGSSANLVMLYSLMVSGKLKNNNVIAPALSWTTTISPLIQLGLNPILCDCDTETLGLDVEHLKVLIKKHKPSVVLLVHVLGFPNKMNEIIELCQENDIVLLEDSCESLGSTYDNIKTGSFGLMSTFSFYFGHHLSTIEGGMITTDDEELYNIVKSLRSHGWNRDVSDSFKLKLKEGFEVDDFKDLYTFYYPGFNLRSTDLQAFLGIHQLDKVEEIVTSRNSNYKLYNKLVTNDYWKITDYKNCYISNFAYPIIHPNIKKISMDLNKNGIECRPLICGSIGNQPYWINLYGKTKFEFADIVDKFGLYVPNNSKLTEDEIRFICSIINKNIT